MGLAGLWTTFVQAVPCAPQLAQIGDATLVAIGVRFVDGGFHRWAAYLKIRERYEQGLRIRVSKIEFEILPERVPAADRPKEWVELQPGFESWRGEIQKNVGFALSHYPRRGWGEEFLEELQALALRYWQNSTYLSVYQGESPVATLRLISSRDGIRDALRSLDPRLQKLLPAGLNGGRWSRRVFSDEEKRQYHYWNLIPAEEVLDVDLERPWWRDTDLYGMAAITPVYGTETIGEAIEPGNFAILQGVAPEVVRAISIEILRAVFDPEHTADYNHFGKVLFTYADQEGKRLYLPMGFEQVDPNDPIEHAGARWWVLRLTPERLQKWIARFERRGTLSEIDVEDLYRLMEFLSRKEQLMAESLMTQRRGREQASSGYILRPRVEAEVQRRRSKYQEQFDLLAARHDLPETLLDPYRELLMDVVAFQTSGERLYDAQEDPGDPYLRFSGGVPFRFDPPPCLSWETSDRTFGILWLSKLTLDNRLRWKRGIDGGPPSFDYAADPEAVLEDLLGAIEDEFARLQTLASEEQREPEIQELNMQLNRKLSRRISERDHAAGGASTVPAIPLGGLSGERRESPEEFLYATDIGIRIREKHARERALEFPHRPQIFPSVLGPEISF